MLKLEFCHFAHPELNLRFVFASFSSKKMRQPAGYTVQKWSALHFALVFFGVLLRVSHFASVFTVVLPTLDFLNMPD